AQREARGSALIFLAAQLDFAAHELHQIAADAEAQARAAKLARYRRVGLAEFLKNRFQVLRLNANAGIRHFKLQRHLAARAGKVGGQDSAGDGNAT
nr:hypothetical protein [Tanacetum cinerariifolium]